MYGWPLIWLVWIQILCLCLNSNRFTFLAKSKPVKLEVSLSGLLPLTKWAIDWGKIKKPYWSQIEDLSRLEPNENSRGRSLRSYNRHEPSYTMETEFHSSGSIAGGGVKPGAGNSGNGRSKRRPSIVSNASKTPHFQTPSAATTIPPILEKQPGITEQVKASFRDLFEACDRSKSPNFVYMYQLQWPILCTLKVLWS